MKKVLTLIICLLAGYAYAEETRQQQIDREIERGSYALCIENEQLKGQLAYIANKEYHKMAETEKARILDSYKSLRFYIENNTTIDSLLLSPEQIAKLQPAPYPHTLEEVRKYVQKMAHEQCASEQHMQMYVPSLDNSPSYTPIDQVIK